MESTLTRRSFLKAAFAATAAAGMASAAPMFLRKISSKAPSRTVWTMVNVCPHQAQADFHLISLPSGRTVAIDMGEAVDSTGIVLGTLASRGIRELDLLVISHFHRDHYDQVLPALRAGLRIKQIACSVPHRMVAKREQPWGCDFRDVQRHLRVFDRQGIKWTVPREGEILLEEGDDQVSGVSLRTICCFDGVNTPVGVTDVNDTSLVCRLQHGNESVLFTGDLNASIGQWLADNRDIASTHLKMPHHGAEGCTPNAFYNRTAPHHAYVTAFKSLWNSDRDKRTREWTQNAGIPTHVSALHGNAVVSLG